MFFKKHNGLRNARSRVDDDNIADAVNFNMMGRAMLGWIEPANQAQRDVIASLNGEPKPKKSKKSKAA